MWNRQLVDALNQLAVKASCMKRRTIGVPGSAKVQKNKLRAQGLLDFNLREKTA